MCHSLNRLCLGRSGVFKQMHKRDGGRPAKMHYRVREAEGVQHFETHYAGAETALLKQSVDGGRGERGGQESFCFISARCVCFVCPLSADGVLTSAEPGYTNGPEWFSTLEGLLAHTDTRKLTNACTHAHRHECIHE